MQVATQIAWAELHCARHTERPGPPGQAAEQAANCVSQLVRHKSGSEEAPLTKAANTNRTRQKIFLLFDITETLLKKCSGTPMVHCP
jgi:hypothetical protein